MPVTRNQSAANAKPSSETAEAGASKDSADKGETSTEAEPPRRDSPDNCSICLGPFNNKSFTSSCAHSFCFVCLKQWSKVKAECPLCKQPFTSIFHNIRSNDNYDIYELPPHNPPRPIDYNFYDYVGGNLTFAAPTHHYFSLSRPSLDADLTLSNFSRFQFRHRRYDRYLNLHPVHGEHQYSYTSSSVSPSTHVSAASWPRGAEEFRRRVYRHDMGPPDLILGTENSTYRLTPAMVAASAHRMHRIMPWLTRELRVLLRCHQNVRMAISVIQPLLTQVTIDSIYFSERVSPLIGRRGRQFIQEFVAFANSALSMQAFDRKAMYRRVPALLVYPNVSSSSDDDDVVEVTDISPETSTQNETSTATAPGVGQSGWDSPIPGPSWESMGVGPQVEDDRVTVSSESDDPVFRPDLNESDSDNSKAGSDIVFVKYDKPWNERSPIQLSSDSDGEGRNRKKRRSKHKKKKKEILGTTDELGKKGKGHKTSKSRGKDKSKAKSKGSSGDDGQKVSEPGTPHKRFHSPTSPDRQKRKKHKRSKDRNDECPGHDRDRELVDRLFAEALAGQNASLASTSWDTEIPGSSKSKDSHRKSGRSGEKDRYRRKKKKKNTSRGSRSPILTSYKKHHSGHKKSTDPNNRNHESEKRRHRHRQSSRENATSEHSSHAGSFERELQAQRSQTLPPPNLGHSMTGSYQPSYLAVPPDTVNIPLNLWVSTWPSLPVSHTFPAPPPSSSFQPPSLPHPSSSSGLPVHELSQPQSEPSSTVMDSHTISSDSSSDSYSDDSHEDVVSSLPKGSRTKQWVEENFPSASQKSSANSPAQAQASSDPTAVINWRPGTIVPRLPQVDEPTAGKSEDVVSIESDDEDIVVCSSASSVKSDSDEVKVIEDSEILSNCNPPQLNGSSVPSTSDVQNDEEIIVTTSNPSSSTTEGTPQTQGSSEQKASSSACGNFQPFKLQTRLNMPKQKVNPLFSAMAHSSDDDDEEEVDVRNKPTASNKRGMKTTEELPNSINHSGPLATNSSSGLPCSTTTTISQRSSTPQQGENSAASSVAVTSSVRNDIRGSQPLSAFSEKANIPTSSSTFSAASSTETIFGLLPPLQTAAAPVTSIISSNLNYLPYPPISVSSSLSSILTQSLPFVVPQPPPPPPLPLHFPFPPLPPLLPPAPPPLFPSVYPTYSQSSQAAATSSSSPLISSRDPKFSDSLLIEQEAPANREHDTSSEVDVVTDCDHNSEVKSGMKSPHPVAGHDSSAAGHDGTAAGHDGTTDGLNSSEAGHADSVPIVTDTTKDRDINLSGAQSSCSLSTASSEAMPCSSVLELSENQESCSDNVKVNDVVTDLWDIAASERFCNTADDETENKTNNKAVEITCNAGENSESVIHPVENCTDLIEPFFDALDPSASECLLATDNTGTDAASMQQPLEGADSVIENTEKPDLSNFDFLGDMALTTAENHSHEESPAE